MLQTNAGDSLISIYLGVTYKQLSKTGQMRAGTVRGRTDESVPFQLDINNANEFQVGDIINFNLGANGLYEGYSFRLSQADLDILNLNCTAAIIAEALYPSNNGLVS